MKRICSLVLSGLLAVFALTGCQSGGASPSGAQPAPSQTGEEKDAVVIGEVWEDGSNKIAYGQRRRYLLGHETHGLMNYPFRTALLAYLSGGDADDFREAMETLRENYPPAAFHSAMNALGTHDTVRILTLLGVGGDCGGESKQWRAEHRLSPEERALGVRRLKLAALVQYAFPGSPTTYYGDEAGMEGFEDPFNRRTYPWGEEDAELIAWYRALGKARRELAPLRRGALCYTAAEGDVLAFTRTWEDETVLCAANAGPAPAELELPGGETRTLGPWEGRLLRLGACQAAEDVLS